MNVAKQTVYMQKHDLHKHSHIMCKLRYLKSDFKKTPCTACNMVSHTICLASLQIRIQLHSRVGWLQENERKGKCKCLENSARGQGYCLLQCSSLHFLRISAEFVSELRWRCLHNQPVYPSALKKKSVAANPISFSLQFKWDHESSSVSRWSSETVSELIERMRVLIKHWWCFCWSLSVEWFCWVVFCVRFW